MGIALCESWLPRGCWYTSTIIICVYYCILCLLVLWSRCILMDEKSCEMQIKYNTAKLKVLLLSCRCSCLCCSFCFIMCYEKLVLLLLLSLSFFLIIVYWLVDQCGWTQGEHWCLTLQCLSFESWMLPWDPVFQDSMRRFFFAFWFGDPYNFQESCLTGRLEHPKCR